MELFGNCGGPVPQGLPVLVGEPVAFCPESAGHDADVLALGELVPSLYGAGSLDGVPAASVPPRMRAALVLGRGWMRAWRERE